MSVDKTKCCKTHTKEKEKSGECCHSEEKESATALTFENETTTYKNKEKHE
jgi:hypothetical protein